MPERFSIVLPDGSKKMIGSIEKVLGRLTLVKEVDPDEHYHKKFGAYGIQLSAIPELQKKGVSHIRLLERGGKILECSIEFLLKKGWNSEFTDAKGKSHGKQRFLKSENWTPVVKKDDAQLTLQF